MRIAFALIPCFAALPSALAQTKSEIRDELFTIDAQILAARAQNDVQALAPLQAQYDHLVAQLGGGDPVREARARASTAQVSALSVGGVQNSVTSTPPGSIGTTTSFTRSATVMIADGATTTDMQTVSGAGAFLWDVDLFVDITHTWCGDLDMQLIAPSGKRVTIATDVAEGFINVFHGAVFDDSPDAPAWAYPHVDNVVSTPLNPEGALHRLVGENPNGVWKLEIKDDAFGDIGVLHSWRLDITTFPAPPMTPMAPALFTSTPALAIPDFVPTGDTIHVTGQGTRVADVRVFVDFSHDWNSDVRFDLVGPSGRRVRMSTFNGGPLDNVFGGTNFFDVMSRLAPTPNPLFDQPIDQYPFLNNVAALQGQTEGALTSFLGDDPNGDWTLEFVDTIGGATGVLNHWELSISTYFPGAPPPATYCLPNGPSATGCVPTIAASGNPNSTHTAPCTITVSTVDGQRSGIIFYGAQGPSAQNWCSGGVGNSTLCVKAPIQRTGAQNSGGTTDQCDGSLSLNWNIWQLAHPAALGNPWMAGEKAHVQGWFRSPADCKTTFLSQAIELTYQP